MTSHHETVDCRLVDGLLLLVTLANEAPFTFDLFQLGDHVSVPHGADEQHDEAHIGAAKGDQPPRQ